MADSRKIVWAYNASDLSLNGTAAEVSNELADQLVKDGRASYADSDQGKASLAEAKSSLGDAEVPRRGGNKVPAAAVDAGSSVPAGSPSQ